MEDIQARRLIPTPFLSPVHVTMLLMYILVAISTHGVEHYTSSLRTPQGALLWRYYYRHSQVPLTSICISVKNMVCNGSALFLTVIHALERNHWDDLGCRLTKMEVAIY